MKIDLSKTLFAATLAVAWFVAPLSAAETEPLAIKFPNHTPKGTPEDLPVGPIVEPLNTKAPKPIEIP